MEILIVIAVMLACAYKAWKVFRIIVAVIVAIPIAILVAWKLRKWIGKRRKRNEQNV